LKLVHTDEQKHNTDKQKHPRKRSPENDFEKRRVRFVKPILNEQIAQEKMKQTRQAAGDNAPNDLSIGVD
jgi:hypothetical protein